MGKSQTDFHTIKYRKLKDLKKDVLDINYRQTDGQNIYRIDAHL